MVHIIQDLNELVTFCRSQYPREREQVFGGGVSELAFDEDSFSATDNAAHVNPFATPFFLVKNLHQ